MSIETTVFKNNSGQSLVYTRHPASLCIRQPRYSLNVRGLNGVDGEACISLEKNSSFTIMIKEMILLENSSSDPQVLDKKRFCIINSLIKSGGFSDLKIANLMKEVMIPCFKNQVDSRKDVEQNLETTRQSFQSSRKSQFDDINRESNSIEASRKECLELVNNISVFLNRQLSIVPSPLTDRPLVSKIDASFPFLGGAKKLQDAIVPADYFMKK